MLQDIGTTLTSRALLGLRTIFRKVKSHSGCVGNELADLGAAAAARPGCIHDHIITTPNNSVSFLPAWPLVPSTNPDDGGSAEPYIVSNLNPQ